MPQAHYKCQQCSKDFIIKYMLIKPARPTCPHCGSSRVKMEPAPRSQPSCSGSDKKSFFT